MNLNAITKPIIKPIIPARLCAQLAGVAALLLLGLLPAAQAQVVMTIANAPTTTPGGPDAIFTGTITNTSATDSFTLGYGQIDGFTLDPSNGAGDVNLSWIFFPTDPESLAPGATYGPDDLFSVSVDPAAPTGLYTGTFGLYDPSGTELTTADFTLNVAAATAPEPSGLVSVGVIAACLLGMGGLAARRRGAART